VQALLQQTPSTQKLFTHSLAAVHVSPLIFLQLPEPSQAFPAVVQVLAGKLSCVPEVMFPHVPFVAAPAAVEHA
jgi:hypothetical protein